MLSPGDSFGEFALISGRPRLASVTCRSNVIAVVLTKNDFNTILGGLTAKKMDDKIKFMK